MATSKTAGTKAKADEKPTTTKPAPPRGIPAPGIKAAEVVVPTMSVVAAAGGAAETAKASATDKDQTQMLKKQELVTRIVQASGAKKKDVKLIVDATLGVLGDALSAGEELNLPPLGKMKVNRQRDEGNAEVLILKLRRGGGKGGGGNEPPEDDASDDEGDDG